MKLLITIQSTDSPASNTTHTSHVVEFDDYSELVRAEDNLKERNGKNGVFYTVVRLFQRE